ncbi:MAG: nuclear transport factor 2 family protein [Proteobacteria bacterium]|nr:nuclear transport factor 2 family protein [Pseudomonadota bacterium]
MTQSSTNHPRDIVREFMKHMESGNYDSAMALVAEDCEYINPPPLGSVKGPTGVLGILEPFFAPTLENELRVVREGVAGSVVFQERLDRHRLPNKWVELPVTGVMEVRDGKIAYWRDYFDAATILSQWPTD